MEEYNWQEIIFPSEKDDWKKIEENNLIFAVNVLYAEKGKYRAYVSKHNSNPEKKVNLLMISNGKEWHYLAIKKTISIVKRNIVKTPQ